MAWIKTIGYVASTGRLREIYDRIKGPGGRIDDIIICQSLRPHSIEGNLSLYKYVLHHPHNTVPGWFLEAIGVWVSSLNRCTYCVDQHFRGLKRLLRDDGRATALRAAIECRRIDEAPLDRREKLAMRYAETLTLAPATMTEAMVSELREAGWTDGEILEINQVAAYFAYANRTVMGLGCSVADAVTGLSPAVADGSGENLRN